MEKLTYTELNVLADMMSMLMNDIKRHGSIRVEGAEFTADDLIAMGAKFGLEFVENEEENIDG